MEKKTTSTQTYYTTNKRKKGASVTFFYANPNCGESKRNRLTFPLTGSLRLQMFEAEEDGAITESELAVILKTALGVARLSVSHLFAAIDVGDTGKVTFGKWNKIKPHLFFH